MGLVLVACLDSVPRDQFSQNQLPRDQFSRHQFSQNQLLTRSIPIIMINSIFCLIIAIYTNELCNSNKKKRSLQSSMVFERFKVLINTYVSSIEPLKESLSPRRLFCSRLVETHFHLSGCLVFLNQVDNKLPLYIRPELSTSDL